MPKKGCKKKTKSNSNNLRRTVISAAPHYLQAADFPVVEMAESTAPVPDPEPASMSEPMPEAVFESAPEPEPIPVPVPEPAPDPVFEAAPQSSTQSDPEPDSYLALEEMDKATEESTVEQHEVDDAPVTGANEATGPASERAEIATEAPAILPEPVVVEYAQPNTRWVGNANLMHKRARANPRKIKSI